MSFEFYEESCDQYLMNLSFRKHCPDFCSGFIPLAVTLSAGKRTPNFFSELSTGSEWLGDSQLET